MQTDQQGKYPSFASPTPKSLGRRFYLHHISCGGFTYIFVLLAYVLFLCLNIEYLRAICLPYLRNSHAD